MSIKNGEPGGHEQESGGDELKLPLIKMMTSEGVQESPHYRQEEVDELAKTDRAAAVALVAEIRAEAEARKARANERKAEERRATEGRVKKHAEMRREIVSALDALGHAPSVDAFLDAAESLQTYQKNLTENDLRMFAAQRDLMVSRSAWNATQLDRMKGLEALNALATNQQRFDRVPESEPAGFFDVRDGKFSRRASGSRGSVTPAPETPPRQPPSLWENAKALFGIKPKK